MRRTRSLEPSPFDPEIERTISRIRKDKQRASQHQTMAAPQPQDDEEPRSLRDYAIPLVDGIPSSIRRPAI